MEGEGNDTTTDNTVSSPPGSTPNEKDEEDRTEVEGSDFDRGAQGENKFPELPDDDEIPPPLPTR